MSRLKRVFTLRMEDEIYNKLGYVSKQEHSSLTNLIEFALIKCLSEYEQVNGVIPDDLNDE